jgi:hypothetical protein
MLQPLRITEGKVFQNIPIVSAVANCVNDIGLGCGLPPAGQDGAGVVTFGQVAIGGETNNQTTSTLFTITYNVTGIGATSISILPGSLSLETSQLVTTSQPGLFSNNSCGSGLCKAPRVSFTVRSNSTLVEGRPVFFNASSTMTLNSGALIVAYDWLYGDGHGRVTALNSTSFNYPTVGNYVAVLRVQDSTNSFGISSYTVHISRFFIDLAIGPDDLSIDQSTYVLPGTQVHIRVTVTNLSSKNENESLSILLALGVKGNLTLSRSSGSQYLNVSTSETRHLDATWDTTNYAPKVYPVIGHVDPVRNGTLIVENVTSNNEVVGFVQLVDPLPAGITLSVLSGVSLAGLLVVAASVSLVRRFSRKPELDTEP